MSSADPTQIEAAMGSESDHARAQRGFKTATRQGRVFRRWLSVWVMVGICILAERLAAEDSNAPPASAQVDLTGMSLEELSTLKIAVVYGASKHEQIETEAPSSVSIVTADEIKKSGYRTLADILNSVRGVYITYDRSYSYIGLRGFNRPGDYGGRILITVDGHRLNDPLYDSAFNGTEFILDVDLIDRVEIIRGPGSSLYGNNAFFAVVNVITRRGRDFHGAELSGAYASYDTYTGRLSYGNRFTNGVELALSGTLFDSAGQEELFYPEFIKVNHGIAENADASHFGSGFASISYGDFSLEAAYVQRAKHIPTAAYGAVFNDPREEVFDERAFAELKFEHDFWGDWHLLSRLYYDHYRYDAVTPSPELAYGDPLYPGQIMLNRDKDKSESAGGEVQLSKVILEHHRLTVGVEYRHDFALDFLNFDEGTAVTYLNTNLSACTLGFYAQDEYAILRNLILNAGVRYDYFSSFGDTVNPRAALIYNPWTNTTLKAIYGQAYRAPNAYELYYEAPGYEANNRLRPETIHSYELVAEQRLGTHASVTSSLFYDQIDDLISFESQPDGSVIFGNLAGATTEGAGLEFDLHWASGWRGQANYTYADAVDSATGQHLSNSPRHLAKLNLTAPLWKQKLFATLELEAMSDRTTVRGNTVEGFWTANFTLFSRQILKGLEVSASVYNLFDQRYYDPVGPDFTQDAIQQDGRSFRVKLTYSF